MLHYTELRGLACLLDVILRLRTDQSAEEIQCLHMKGKRVLAAGNSATESKAIADGLNAAGVAAGAGINALMPVYVAVKNEQGKWFPDLVSKDRQRVLWPTASGSLSIPALDALAARRKVPEGYRWGTWTADTTWADVVANPPKLKKDQSTDAAKRLAKVVLRGMLMLGFDWLGKAETYLPPKPKKGAAQAEPSEENTFAAVTATTGFSPKGFDEATLPASDSKNPALCVAAAYKPSGKALHAEQSLLRAVAWHVRAGGPADKFEVGGQKPPCAGCEPVLKKFAAAYLAKCGMPAKYDETKGSTKANTEALDLPAKDGAVGVTYGELFDEYAK